MAAKLFVYPPIPIDKTGLATEAKQDIMISELQDINTELDTHTTELQDINTELNTQTTELQSINTELDTQTTELQSINTELDSQTTELQSINTELDSQTTELQSINTELDSQTTQLTNLNSKIDGDPFAIDHDYRQFTYVAAGTGEGEPQTAVLRDGGAGGTLVRTVTFTYTTNTLGDAVVDTISW